VVLLSPEVRWSLTAYLFNYFSFWSSNSHVSLMNLCPTLGVVLLSRV